ncbi:MAG: CopG family antitoxin [Anaerolineae bacterium]|jgi:hypothetical protein
MRDKREPIPESFDAIEEFWQFWDTHSSADYEDLMVPVDVEVDLLSSKTYCAISKDVLHGIRAQARQQGISTETLINLWLQEKLSASRLHGAAYSLGESSEDYVADEGA